MAIVYPWKRFWAPRGSTVHLWGGYLPDPDDGGRYINPDVVPFASVQGIACLVLLGEPGSGKSHALEEIGNSERAEGGPDVLYVDLRSYSDQSLLYQAVFGSREFREWVGSDSTLEVVLDSLDECMVHVRTVSAMLVDELKKHPIDRLRLRIACRTAEWPALLEEALPQLWGGENTRVLELAPLRREDVAVAAQCEGLDADEFLAAVEAKDVVVFAVKPVTLKMLLKSFKDDEDLPGDQSGIYGQGCLTLCRDPSPSRGAAQATGVLTAHQKLAIATRIAALCVLGKRVALQVGEPPPGSARNELQLTDVTGGSEPCQGGPVQVDAQNLSEVLRHTQFFSGRGPELVGWSHWTHAEYLTAVYVKERGMSEPQVRGLFLHPGAEGRKRVVPQLAETAAWYAGMESWFFDLVAENDPQVLLRSAVVGASEPQKARLVAALLRLADEGTIVDADLDLRSRNAVLGHEGLASQLAPYFTDRTKGVVVRRMAIDIAEANSVGAVVPRLLELALDRSDELHIRAQAAHAVARIGEDCHKNQMRPLLRCLAEEDPEDELKGIAMEALWPGLLSASELFQTIQLPSAPNYFGMYHSFLSRRAAEGLRTADLPAALEWVAAQPSDHVLSSAFGFLLTAVLELAWEHLEDGAVLKAFAETAALRLKRHDLLLGPEDRKGGLERVVGDEAKRRTVAAAIICTCSVSADDAALMAWSTPCLCPSEDFGWVLRELIGAPAELAEKWGKLACAAFHVGNICHVRAVLDASDGSASVKRAFSYWLEAVAICSARAAEERRTYESLRDTAQRHKERAGGLPRPFEEILRMSLERFEAGDIDAWWQLNYDMTIDPVRGVYQINMGMHADLTKLPGWDAMSPQLRARTVEAAGKYLDEGQPATAEWLGTDKIHWPALAGRRAAQLLLGQCPDRLARLSMESWRKWAPAIVAFPESIGIGSPEPMEELVGKAYANAPAAALETLGVLIDSDNRAALSLHRLKKFARCWDQRLTDMLLAKARGDSSLRAGSVGDILDHALQHSAQRAGEYAISLVESRSDSERDRALAEEAAIALLKHSPTEGWPAVWARLSDDPLWGERLFKCLAHHHDRRNDGELGGQLAPSDTARLFVWLCRRFPPGEDPEPEGVHEVGDRESVAMFRDALVRQLREQGAVAAIRQIRDELPELKGLKYAEIVAEDTRLRQTWDGVEPAVLQKMVQNADSRLVDSGEQLLAVAIESLRRLERDLQGTPPAVRDLWNVEKQRTVPKDEAHLSDYLVRYFRRDLAGRGIVVNREVQIRPGQETDIWVDAVTKSASSDAMGTVSVVVEVKGSWHAELKTAMEDQLRDRYMADNECRHGLYLVGWFLCDDWSSEDGRRARHLGWSLEEARKFFGQQTTELSDGEATLSAFVLDASFR